MGNFTSDTIETIGTVCIVFITSSLIFTWGLFLPGLVATIIEVITGLCKKKPKEEEKKQKKKKGKKSKMTEDVEPVPMTGEDDKEFSENSGAQLKNRNLQLEKMDDEKMSKMIYDNLSKPASNAPKSGKRLVTSNN